MHPSMKRLLATVGALALVFGVAFTALSTTTQQIGLNGKQVYTYDPTTGFSRMEVIISSIAASLATATAAAPTLIEGALANLSVDLANNLRVTLGTLISGEDQTNNLLMTSGGVVRQTQILGTGGVPSTATDATTTAQIVPTGTKTFFGTVTCTGTCVQTQKIYGDWNSDAANGELLCTLTLNATTVAFASCIVTTDWSYYYVVTTATSGTTPLAGVFAMY